MNQEATHLTEKAQQAYEQHDIDEASKLLERALKLDANYKAAWQQLGTVRMDQGRFDDGLGAFRKAINLDSRDVQSYKMLARGYEGLHRHEEAMNAWRELLKQDPNNEEAHLNAGSELLALKRYREAIPELEAVSGPAGPGPHVEFDLADAYFGLGDNAKAVAALKKAGQTSTYSETWNKVAYTLADHNAGLLDAQLYAVKAVHSAEDAAVQTSISDLAPPDFIRMAQLASFWATLGWVYLRQGDLQKAQKYLESGWSLKQSREIGEHLAEVYKKQGKAAESEHQFALAHELADRSAVMVLRRSNGSNLAATSDRRFARELAEMRRTKLGNLTMQKGRAEYFVLLAPDGTVEDVKFIRGDEQIRSLSKALTSITFRVPLPDDAPVKIVLRGTLACSGDSSGCDFTLFPVDSVSSE